MVHKDTCIWRWEPPFQLSVGPRIAKLTVLAPKTTHNMRRMNAVKIHRQRGNILV